MGCRLLEVLIPAVISALLLGEGVQCKNTRYTLTKVPSKVTVEDGLCVHIPCQFTYDSSQHPPQAQIYGYWYAEDEESSKRKTRQHRLVATNDPNRIRETDPQRFEMSATKLNLGNCSLTILDARATDQAKYHFQMKKGDKKHSYYGKKDQASVKVTERKVDITIWGSLIAGKTKFIYCKTQRCSSKVPKITWKYVSQKSVLRNSQSVNKESVKSHVIFKPKVEDHRQNITCIVTYGEGSSHRSVEKTVMLDVHYPPRIRFSGRIQHLNGYVKDFEDVYRVDARVNDSFLVRCEVDANPKSSQTWWKMISHPSETWDRISVKDKLKISALKQRGERKYKCVATNKEGSSSEVFSLRVTGYDHSPMVRP